MSTARLTKKEKQIANTIDSLHNLLRESYRKGQSAEFRAGLYEFAVNQLYLAGMPRVAANAAAYSESANCARLYSTCRRPVSPQ